MPSARSAMKAEVSSIGKNGSELFKKHVKQGKTILVNCTCSNKSRILDLEKGGGTKNQFMTKNC